ALTVAQRIWPDDPAYADRFRKVPFTARSVRSEERESRDAFEKGCSEARGLLRLWITEVQKQGLSSAPAGPAAAAPDLGTAMPDGEAELLLLDEDATAATAPASVETSPSSIEPARAPVAPSPPTPVTASGAMIDLPSAPESPGEPDPPRSDRVP